MKKIVGIVIICLSVIFISATLHADDSDERLTVAKAMAKAANSNTNIRPDFDKGSILGICDAVPEGDNDYLWGGEDNNEKKLPPYGAVEITPELSYCYIAEICKKHTDYSYWDTEYEDCLDEFGISFLNPSPSDLDYDWNIETGLDKDKPEFPKIPNPNGNDDDDNFDKIRRRENPEIPDNSENENDEFFDGWSEYTGK